MATPSTPNTQLQLRIELMYLEPAIWRSVLVPDTITLSQLHSVIQATMGWWNSHLHEFEIGDQRYGMVDPEWDDIGLIDEKRKRLVKVLGRRKRFTYLYDFGDSWLHQITVEQVLPMTKPQRYATCIAGENACPPEDVGGAPGYCGFLEAVLNPGHEEHKRMLEWCGGPFDPGHFDREVTNRELKQIRL